ncbi:unnamed protein product [Rotaria sp. Silwood2]|nr:unnamed protein product [Rotaria sp. Silwood2]
MSSNEQNFHLGTQAGYISQEDGAFSERGGEKKLVNNDGKEILLKIQKEKDERLSHDKAGLISMSIYDCTTRFFITLSIRKVYEFNPGQICGDGGTGDIVYHDQDDIAGEPKDTVLVYACGER